MAKPGKIHTLDDKACQLVSCSYCSQNFCSLPNHLTGKYLNIIMYVSAMYLESMEREKS